MSLMDELEKIKKKQENCNHDVLNISGAGVMEVRYYKSKIKKKEMICTCQECGALVSKPINK